MNLTLPSFELPHIAGFPTRSRGVSQKKAGKSAYELLAELGTGNSSLERVVQAVAAELGIFFDGAQWYAELGASGEYTLIDFVMFYPKRAIYVDGPQHDFRPEIRIKDLTEAFWLESDGWTVIRLHWTDILADPYGTVARILWQI